MAALTLRPNLTLREANRFVHQHHRHHHPARGAKFVLGAVAGEQLVGVLIAGRPVSRGVDPETTLEVTRCCTDGTRNACSFLYGAAARVAKALGYHVLQTYTLARESGASLRAAGFHPDGIVPGRPWEHASAQQLYLDGSTRHQDQPTVDKSRWVKRLAA
jgi:hypothetical protein